ncbi:hypothetical protein [Niallia taxi]|uniref:hypothetical protein n=1 Tax=Niallia taxi TaxID=2499688 RepID=UPI0015F64E17|nr:hypothetical protein [Niallia taxi]
MLNTYFVVGILNSPYKQQIFEAESREEAIEKYTILYNLSKSERAAVQVFHTLMGTDEMEKWMSRDRGSKDD